MCQLWHTLDRSGCLPSPHPTHLSIIPKKTKTYDQHLTNNHRKKKIIKYFTTKQNIVQSFFFLANIFSTYFSPSTFSPKKFSHFFHNPQDSLAARLTHSLTHFTHHTNTKKDKKMLKMPPSPPQHEKSREVDKFFSVHFLKFFFFQAATYPAFF